MDDDEEHFSISEWNSFIWYFFSDSLSSLKAAAKKMIEEGKVESGRPVSQVLAWCACINSEYAISVCRVHNVYKCVYLKLYRLCVMYIMCSPIVLHKLFFLRFVFISFSSLHTFSVVYFLKVHVLSHLKCNNDLIIICEWGVLERPAGTKRGIFKREIICN